MPLADRPVVVVVAIAYLALVSLIGLAAAARTRTQRDFFIAGQRVGLLVTGLATMSAAFSGFVFLGGPGLTYRIGVASLMIVLPIGVTGGLLCWTLGKRLRLLAASREIYTIPDAIAARFPGRAPAALAAIAVLVGSVAYLGLQVRVMGLVLTRLLALEPSIALLLGLTVLVLYSVAGGMIAGVYTDVLQGALMLLAALLVFVRAVTVSGGWEAMLGAIDASERFGGAFLEPLGGAPALTAFGFFFVFGVGVLGQPQMLHKFYMLDDPNKLRWMPWILGGSQAMCLLIWIGIGLAVPSLVAQGRLAPLADPDSASLVFLLEHASDLLAGLVCAGIVAAVMSTADALLNVASAAVVRDLPRALGRAGAASLGSARAAVLLVAAFAGAFAWLYGDLIALLGTFAFGTLAAALAPALAVGLNWTRVTPAAASASIATGLTLNLLLEFLAKQNWFDALPRPPLAPGALPSAVSLAASFAVLFAVTRWTRPVEPDEAVAEVMRA